MSPRRRLTAAIRGAAERVGAAARKAGSVVPAVQGRLAVADAVLLLARIPRSAAVLTAVPGSVDGMSHWGLPTVAPADADLVVTSDAGAAARLGRPQVLLLGKDRQRVLVRTGYTVTRYRIRSHSPHTVAVGSDTMAHRLASSAGGSPRGTRARVLRVAGAVIPSRVITVATLGGETLPAALAQSGLVGGARSWCLMVDRTDARRRAVALISDERGLARTAIKMSRSPGETDRGRREQRVLALLPDRSPAPRPLGCGSAGPVAWSAESVRRGRALNRVLPRPGQSSAGVLGQLSSWLADLAVATAHTVSWPAVGQGDGVVALRGPAAGLRSHLHELQDVPAVLAHGDLESGGNVLVDTGRISVIDWETGREHGLPLLDLVPSLCAALARATRARGIPAQAEEVISLAMGRSSNSRWLFGQVGVYAARLGIDPSAVGRLALLAWGHHASMRLVHDELLEAAGIDPHPWLSLAEQVLPLWQSNVGPAWEAFSRSARVVPTDGGR